MSRVLLRLTLVLLIAVMLPVYLHFRHTGLTPHRYVALGTAALDSDTSYLRQQAAALTRRLTLTSGLLADPVQKYPPDLEMRLPVWRGEGANALRESVRPRYFSDGQPIALTDSNHWLLNPPSLPSHDIVVDSVASLVAALKEARSGTRIILAPGEYVIASPLPLTAHGSAHRPVQLTAARLGEAVLVFRDGGALQVSGPYWAVTDIVMRGECDGRPCSAPMVLGEQADHFTARNLFVTGLTPLLTAGTPAMPLGTALAEGITLLNGTVGNTGPEHPERLNARSSAIRYITRDTAAQQLITLCAPTHLTMDCDTTSLSSAASQVGVNGLILMRRGDYRQAAHFRTPGVHLLAEPGTRLLDTATDGKGALVVSAPITVEGLECSGISVSDGNGACLRQNRGDVTLRGVHFHHSQMGILTGHEGGNIHIYDSYIHDSGTDGSDQLGHNVYVNSGELRFIRSWSLKARNAGHDIKSRAAHTRLEDCLIASVNARDSRLVDVPDGGELIVTGCVLGKGPRSENQDMIGFGLEIGEGGPPHPENRIRLASNTLYDDRPQGARMLNALHAEDITATNNIAVGLRIVDARLAIRYRSRDSAGVPAYPALPPLTYR